MRPYLFAAAVALTAFAAPAQAATCTATADTPVTAGAIVMADGSFGCDVARSGMTVTVCLEALRPSKFGPWERLSCETATGSGTTVAAGTSVCLLDGPTLVRTTATGSNDAGETAAASSLPTWAPGVGSCGP